MNLYEKIKTIYPSLTQQDFMSVISLQDDSDGKGEYIKIWNHITYLKPTEEQLNSIG